MKNTVTLRLLGEFQANNWKHSSYLQTKIMKIIWMAWNSMSFLQRCLQKRATSWEWLSEGCIMQMAEAMKSAPELGLLIIVSAVIVKQEISYPFA